jgi:dinuclear metal center YbgI/SA1388 family protein
LTIDSSDAVLAEATELDCQLVVSYHPPIFGGLKRLSLDDRAARLAITAIENGIAVYSPHTALDAASGGVNDWLADAFGAADRRAIVPRGDLIGLADPAIGQGRHLTLHRPLTLAEAIAAIKSHLKLDLLRVARAREAAPEIIRTVGLCAGAGGSVLSAVTADLLLTGEMRHHDVLHRCESGSHIVLTEHSNSERGFLPHYARAIASRAPGVELHVSKVDADPLRIA